MAGRSHIPEQEKRRRLATPKSPAEAKRRFCVRASVVVVVTVLGGWFFLQSGGIQSGSSLLTESVPDETQSKAIDVNTSNSPLKKSTGAKGTSDGDLDGLTAAGIADDDTDEDKSAEPEKKGKIPVPTKPEVDDDAEKLGSVTDESASDLDAEEVPVSKATDGDVSTKKTKSSAKSSSKRKSLDEISTESVENAKGNLGTAAETEKGHSRDHKVDDEPQVVTDDQLGEIDVKHKKKSVSKNSEFAKEGRKLIDADDSAGGDSDGEVFIKKAEPTDEEDENSAVVSKKPGGGSLVNEGQDDGEADESAEELARADKEEEEIRRREKYEEEVLAGHKSSRLSVRKRERAAARKAASRGRATRRSRRSRRSRRTRRSKKSKASGIKSEVSPAVELTPVVEPLPAAIVAKMDLPTNTEDAKKGCFGMQVYIYPLPTKFNLDLLAECKGLNPWYDMCPHLQSDGLGQKVRDAESLVPADRWYETHQYALEVIFHNRLRRSYNCLTDDPDEADLFYIPFYGGLDIMRWHFAKGATYKKRDALSKDLAAWLKLQPHWQKYEGADHVIVLGRGSWDFRRGDSDWGNVLLDLPALEKVTSLVLEHPWEDTDVAIPHPTQFHPKTDRDVAAWQRQIKVQTRESLASFAGLPDIPATIKENLSQQCQEQPSFCRFMECVEDVCHRPEATAGLYQGSVFCIVPPGEGAARRAAFEALIAGCIPVIFDEYTTQKQYTWHLPADNSSFSIYVPQVAVEKDGMNIIDLLKDIPTAKIEAMRENIVDEILPGLLYNHPRTQGTQRKDAFDIAMDRTLRIAHLARQQQRSSTSQASSTELSLD